MVEIDTRQIGSFSSEISPAGDEQTYKYRYSTESKTPRSVIRISGRTGNDKKITSGMGPAPLASPFPHIAFSYSPKLSPPVLSVPVSAGRTPEVEELRAPFHPRQAIAAPGLFQRLDAQQHILVVIPHRNQVMRIMCHRRGNGSVKEKALYHTDAHPACSSMPLHHRNFLKAPVRLEFSGSTRHLADPVPCQNLMGIT